jgi:hypothetical protein
MAQTAVAAEQHWSVPDKTPHSDLPELRAEWDMRWGPIEANQRNAGDDGTKACSGGHDRDAWAKGKIRLAREMPGNMPRQQHSRRDFFGAGSWFRSSQNRQLLPGAKPSKRRCKTQSILPPCASIQCEQRLALMTKVTKSIVIQMQRRGVFASITPSLD